MVDIKVDENLVRKIADMAMLDLSDEEIKEFVSYFKEMFDVFETLQNLDTDYDLSIVDAHLRPDIPKVVIDYHDLWMRMSLMKGGYLLVPPLKGGEEQ